jgi:hypothetical protein
MPTREDESESRDDDDDEVEIVARKKVGKIPASQASKRPVRVMPTQEDESESEDDENGEFDSLSSSYHPYALFAWLQWRSCSRWR